MRILLAAVEMTPFLKIGGVGDVIGQWAAALARRGHEITVALPTVAADGPRPPAWLDLQVFRTAGFSPEDPYAFEDDWEGRHVYRLRHLADAIIGLCRARAVAGAPFDILHVNEWPVALLPFLLSRRGIGFARPRTVLTIHGVAYRGLLPAWAFEQFGVDPFGPPRIVDARGLIRPLGAGILCADVLATPSPTYAREIVDPNLQGVLSQELLEVLLTRAEDIHGILHGLDRDVWNPATDAALPYRYCADDLGGKRMCKTYLEGDLRLAGEPGAPILLSAGRLCREKGTEFLVALLPSLAARGVRTVIAGTGDPDYTRLVTEAVARAPRGFATYVGWADSAQMRRLFAAADLLLMPSVHEACGLTQMEAQRYGAVPVVRHCGGLADTVIGHTPGATSSTGFVFEEASISALAAALDEALALLPSVAFVDLQRRCIEAPRGWAEAAEAYEQLYRQALARAVEPG